MAAIFRTLNAIAILAVVVFALGLHEARRDPAVRTARVSLPDWPVGLRPLRVALISDIHFGNEAMDRPRLTRIVNQIDAYRPDLIVIAGDFVAGHRVATAVSAAAAIAEPLGRLMAPLGVVATLGNHDYSRAGALRAALASANITLLENAAVRRGPLTIGGLGDVFTLHDDLPATLTAMARLRGVPLIVAHSPDRVHKLPASVRLMLAGHTHCGQIVIPWFGPVAPIGIARYRCGIVVDPGRVTVITAGLGTSIVPLRFGAPPDWWLVTLGG